MLLPEKKNLIFTNEEDPLPFYYWPVVGYFYKKRLRNTLKLMEDKKYGRVLEIGFGSGILFPELARHANTICGIETHPYIKEVAEMAKSYGVKDIDLRSASITKIPYPDNYFDLVLSVSTLEHIDELDDALREIKRVTKPGGDVISSFPAKNVAMNILFRLLGFVPSHIHPNSHRDIEQALMRHFTNETIVRMPTFLPADIGFYSSILSRKK